MKICPTDAIIGAKHKLHFIINDLCNGCELCISECPVDCMSMTTNPKKELFKILNERKVSYNLADFNVESGKKNTIQQTSQKVIDTLKNRPDVLNSLGN